MSFLRTLALLGFVLLPLPSRAAAPAVELVADTPFLQPTSTLEVRFPRPMVSRDDLGIAAKMGPLVLDPAIAGNWTWLSRSSGVFTPDAAWPLSSTWTASLQPGLKAADGKPLGATLRVKLQTPPFGHTAVRSGVSDEKDASAMPNVAVAFNLAVEPAEAAKLVQFSSARGDRVTATIRHATRRDYFTLQPEQADWEERWQLSRAGAAAKDEQETEENEDEDAELPPLTNRLVITPAEPLTPGSPWRLELRSGLASLDGKHRTAESIIVPIGMVQPFQLTELTTESYINSGRSLTVNFSRNLAQDITSDTASRFFRIEPAVPNVRFDAWGEAVTVRGDFERGRDYRFLIEPAVISNEGLPLEGARERAFRFEPVAPRLYLPKITGHQVRDGQRKFDVLSVNLKSLRVTARLVAAGDVAAAIGAFKKYDRENTDDYSELYQALPPGVVRGALIHERTIELPSPQIDARQQTQLAWDEILGGQKAGAIFLTVEGEPLAETGGKRCGAQALIQLTDLGVLWKKVESGLQATVFSMATGKPLEGVGLALLDPQFARMGAGTTDAAGDIALPFRAAPGWLVASLGQDVHALRIGAEGQDLPMAAFRLPIEYGGWEPPADGEKSMPLRAHIFTDRPLYQPGETVRVKGLVRSLNASGLAITDGLAGVVRLRDPRGDEAAAIDVRTDARGAFDAEVKLGAKTGRFSLALEFADAPNVRWQSGMTCSFDVTDYQPNAFEVVVALPGRLAPEAAVQGGVTARYLFGAPLTQATATWTLQIAEESFSPDGFLNWTFGSDSGAAGKALTLRGEAVLGSADGFTIAPQLPATKVAPHRGILTVELTDINQQTVSESRQFVRDAADFYLGLAIPEGVVFRPGGKIVARAVAVRPDGQPVADAVNVSAELVFIRHETVRVQGAGKAISFRTEKIEESVAKAAGKTLAPIRQGDTWEVRNGESVSFTATRAGQYAIRVTAKDAAGRAVVSTLPVYVTGPDETAWEYRTPQQIDLVPDKSDYRPGETARILVKTPISGEALVTVEREKRVLRTMRMRLNGNAPMLEIPLEKSDAPNVFVSVMLLRGREQSTHKSKAPDYRYGIAMLTVTDPAARLQVEVAAAKKEVEPGDEVATEVRVLDGAGAPVADAEVTFFAVDDGILALTGYERPTPGAIFGAPLPLAIRTGLTLFQLLPEDPAALEFANKGYLIGGGGLDGPAIKLRRDFPGTACWMPKLRTDRAGKVTVRFTAPDAITRYRLVAVAHAKANLFGSAESAVAIRKPLMILPALGQIANVGDELIARAVIRNDTGADGSVEVTLDLDGKAEPVVAGAITAKLEVPNGAARSFDFPVRIRETGEAAWTWTAKIGAPGAQADDRVVSTLVVGSPAPLLRETYLPDLSAEASDLLAGVNPQLLEGSGSATVMISNTRMTSLRESVKFLFEYPYECAEQTVSGLLPWTLLPELRPVLTDFPAKTDAEVQAAIGKGLDQLAAMQTQGGGIAMWPGGRHPSLFISAYAALLSATLEKQDVPIPLGIESLCKFLSDELRGSATIRDERALGDRALALWALAAADRAEPAYHEELFRRRKELSHESRALLALAILEARGPAPMVDALLDPKIAAPEAFSFIGGPARERALQLLAWSRHKPRSPEIARLVKELIAHRRSGHWGTTQENAWAILAMARYYSAVEKGAPATVTGALQVNDRTTSVSLSREEPAATFPATFTPAAPLIALSVSNPARSPLFGEARFTVRPPVADQPRQDRGYAVSRSYRKLAGDGSLVEATDLRVGDRIVVTLRVETARPGHFVAIDDPLPAIFEAVNPAFESREIAGATGLARDWASDYSEMRKDRVLYFCDHLPAGAFTFRYLARVRSAGSVMAGATKAEEMYRPERFGLSETARLEARTAETK